MNTTLADVVIFALVFGSLLAIIWIAANWYRLSHGWIADDPDAGMSDVHPDLRDIPPFAPSMGGTPAEAHLLASMSYGSYGRRSEPRQKLTRSYCPQCETEKWRTGRRVPVQFPAGVPRLCDLHAPTIVTPAVSPVYLDVAPTSNREMR